MAPNPSQDWLKGSNGNFYGTPAYGGSHSSCGQDADCGTVYWGEPLC
jgi:hypothetical protein